MLVDDRLIDLLQRHFDLAIAAPDTELHLEAIRFFDCLDQHEVLREHVRAIEREYFEAHAQFRHVEEPLVAEGQRLRDRLLALAPAWDDGAFMPTTNLKSSLADFDFQAEVFEKVLGEGVSMAGSQMLSSSLILARILVRGAAKHLPAAEQSSAEAAEMRKDILAFHDVCERETRKFAFWHRVAPAYSLVFLRQLKGRLHPQPESPTFEVAKIVGHSMREAISGGGVPEPPEGLRSLRNHLARVHVEMRARVSMELSHIELVNRFKHRAEWFDRDRLRDLAFAVDRQREAPLVRELARFLFDHGVDVVIEAMLGNVRADVVNFARALVIEGKVTRDVSGRGDILQGISQTYSYAKRMRAKGIAATEAHFIAFRLEGPSFDLPSRVSIGATTIHLTTVDLATSEECGRRQGDIVTITAEDIAAAVRGAS